MSSRLIAWRASVHRCRHRVDAIPSIASGCASAVLSFASIHLRASSRVHPALHEIIENGGGYDCFGNRIPFTGNKRSNNAGSIIAQQSQAYELRVMLAVLDLAEHTDAFTIALWQHDGCSIAVHDRRRKNHWVNAIISAVNECASTLQIYTTLERADDQKD